MEWQLKRVRGHFPGCLNQTIFAVSGTRLRDRVGEKSDGPVINGAIAKLKRRLATSLH